MPASESAVRRALQKHTIRESDLPDVTSLEIQSSTITSSGAVVRTQVTLDGIERCQNLQSLSFSFVELHDLTPLGQLPHLGQLEFRSCTITDLSAIEECRSLRHLELDAFHGPRPRLDRLPELEWLAHLSISPEDLEVIGRCPRLRELYLVGSLGDDFGPLANLTELRVLELTRREHRAADVIEENVEPIARLKNLRRLSLVGFYRFDETTLDVTPLESLTNLELLRLSDNGIDDISPLSRLDELRGLALDANQIADVAPLSGLNKLELLFLDSNRISDISPLANLVELQCLSVGQNRIQDLTPLANLTDLRALKSDENQVREISSLVELQKLGEVNANTPSHGWDPIRRTSPHGYTVQNWDHYAGILDLSDNEITDVSGLSQNPGLAQGDRIDLRGNPLSEAARESQIPALQQRGVEVRYDRTDVRSDQFDPAHFEPGNESAAVTAVAPIRIDLRTLPQAAEDVKTRPSSE